LNKKSNKVGINEIAEALGISKSTVSRALNNHPKISEATKQKVLKQAHQLGYTPNIPDLISNKESRSVVLLLPHTKNIFFNEIIESVRAACELKQYSLFVCESNYDIAVEAKCIDQIKALGFQALIYVAHGNTEQLEGLDYLAKSGLPISIIHENHLKSTVPTVILDVHQSLFDGIKHLKSNDAQRIGLIIDEEENSICGQVNGFFKNMLIDEGLTYYPEFIYNQAYKDTINIPLLIDQMFSEETVPDALIFGSYDYAYKAFQYLNAKQLNVDPVLIMSIHSSKLMNFAKPNITYLHLQGLKLGSEAARLVFKQLNKAPKSSTKVFFSRLIIKSSSLKV